MKFLVCPLIFTAFVLFGCQKSEKTHTNALVTVPLRVGSALLKAEVAGTAEEKALGLMHRKTLGSQEGMLFILDGPQRASFWMKNTTIPLSIAYLDQKGTIVEVVDLEPLSQKSVLSQSDEIYFALEVNSDTP